jgi:hypothetical protein
MCLCSVSIHLSLLPYYLFCHLPTFPSLLTCNAGAIETCFSIFPSSLDTLNCAQRQSRHEDGKNDPANTIALRTRSAIMGVFNRTRSPRKKATNDPELTEKASEDVEMKRRNAEADVPFQETSNDSILPTAEPRQQEVNSNGHLVTVGIQPDGESGRKGIHPWHFLRICWRSTSRASRLCNILWPVVPSAIAVKYARGDLHLVIFILNYIAMIPCANLIGFAGQELARKLHKVFGVLLETTLGSVVEIVLFGVLLRDNEFKVIQAAILGSVLATQLLCLGMCFFVGGVRYDEQEFDEVVGEVGSDLLLTA